MQKLRTSVEKSNARYRGVTEKTEYTNYVLSAVHDMKLLGKVLDTDEYNPAYIGQSDAIESNFANMLYGSKEPIISNTKEVVTIYHPTENLFPTNDLMDTKWTVYGECTKRLTEDKTVVLTSTGRQQNAGIRRTVDGKEGDIYYIRVAIKLIDGATDSFSIGSENINFGKEDVSKQKLEKDVVLFMDKRLYCKERTEIVLNIDVNRLSTNLSVASVEVLEAEIRRMEESEVSIAPIQTKLRVESNRMKEKLKELSEIL